MKHASSKKALLILIVFTVIGFFGSLIASIIGAVLTAVSGVSTVVSAIIELVVAIAFLVAYFIGAKDSKNFNTVKWIEIFDILVGILSFVFAFIFVLNNANTWATTVGNVMKIISAVIDVLVFYFVCEACAEVAEDAGVTKSAKTTFTWYTVAIVLSLICTIISMFGNVVTGTIASVVALLAVIAALVSEILQFVLIIKAHKRCK